MLHYNLILYVAIHLFQWEKIHLGLASARYVYQGCNSKLKNKFKTLWTKWIEKKDAYELRLDLLFAQDDQIPVTIQLLESNIPVEHPHTGQMRQQIVAPHAFTQPARPKDVETHLYHVQGLDLGRITRNGFHLGFSYSGSCMIISSMRVFYMKCPGLIVNQTTFGEASAGSGWIRGQCVNGAKEVSTPKIECKSNGQWGVMQGFCVCGAGYQTEEDICKGQMICSVFTCCSAFMGINLLVQFRKCAQCVHVIAAFRIATCELAQKTSHIFFIALSNGNSLAVFCI